MKNTRFAYSWLAWPCCCGLRLPADCSGCRRQPRARRCSNWPAWKPTRPGPAAAAKPGANTPTQSRCRWRLQPRWLQRPAARRSKITLAGPRRLCEAYYGSAGGLTTNPQWRFAGGRKAAFTLGARWPAPVMSMAMALMTPSSALIAIKMPTQFRLKAQSSSVLRLRKRVWRARHPGRWWGSARSGASGYAVSSAGDVNGDGLCRCDRRAPWYCMRLRMKGRLLFITAPPTAWRHARSGAPTAARTPPAYGTRCQRGRRCEWRRL